MRVLLHAPITFKWSVWRRNVSSLIWIVQSWTLSINDAYVAHCKATSVEWQRAGPFCLQVSRENRHIQARGELLRERHAQGFTRNTANGESQWQEKPCTLLKKITTTTYCLYDVPMNNFVIVSKFSSNRSLTCTLHSYRIINATLVMHTITAKATIATNKETWYSTRAKKWP